MRNNERNVMKAVKINKEKLLGIIKGNKEKHIEDYVEAVEDYKQVVYNMCEHNLELADIRELSAFKEIKSIPSAPTSYENEYTRAIRMLELSVEDVIEVEQDVFNQLVLDEWNWKRSFSVLNATYKTLL